MAKKGAAQGVDLHISTGDSGAKIERIRQLIFGQQIKEYNQRFELLGQDVARLQSSLNQLNDDTHEQFNTLTQKLQEQEQARTAQLHEQDQRLTQLLRETDERLSQQHLESDRRHNEQAEELRQLLRQTDEAVRLELRTALEQLNNLKMDRFTLSDLLIQLANSMKRTGPEEEAVSLLDELTGEFNLNDLAD